MRIHKEGIEGIKINTLIFLLIIAVVTATGLMYDWAWWVLALVDGFLLWRIAFVIRFFRDPERPQLTDSEGVFSPADGKVVVIEEVDEPEVMGGRCIQLSVYMNFYNVHVNWAPVGGEVTYKNHYNGEFVLAWRPKSSHLNEHTTIGVRTDRGTVVMFRQIA
ncbi:MAG: phosphatidylserine decarboxylase, partial [Tidjanibacter sp.]|nr:phosphatidylserine decarboxylase [Tidjanibacter sp.]